MTINLSTYHNKSNPIELAWLTVKYNVTMNNTKFKFEYVEKLLWDRVDIWSNFVSNIIKIKDKIYVIKNIGLTVMTITGNVIPSELESVKNAII